jgi:hypothetical protein
MIQPLRRQHRVTFVFLAVVLPVVFAAALFSRPKPSGGRIYVRSSSNITNSQKHLFLIATTLDSNGTSSVSIEPRKVILAPDVLVYYADSAPQQNSLPTTARLLGEYDMDTFYPLPESTGEFLVLYSSTHKSVIDFVTLGSRQ